MKNIKVGDRVVISAVIAEGKCEYCQKQQYSLCDWTNSSKEMEALYGHRTSGIFGYSGLTGGFDGLQQEYARVPLADMTLLKVPMGIPDEKVSYIINKAISLYNEFIIVELIISLIHLLIPSHSSLLSMPCIYIYLLTVVRIGRYRVYRIPCY